VGQSFNSRQMESITGNLPFSEDTKTEAVAKLRVPRKKQQPKSEKTDVKNIDENSTITKLETDITQQEETTKCELTKEEVIFIAKEFSMKYGTDKFFSILQNFSAKNISEIYTKGGHTLLNFIKEISI
jgi:hypothetical protein